MFNFFKKKSPLEKLQQQYEKLVKEAFVLSKTDRMASDAKQAEAAELLRKIEALQKSH